MDAISNIKNAVGQLRANMDDAFGEDVAPSQNREQLLARMVVGAVKGNISIDWLLKDSIAVLEANSAVVWVQRGDDTRIFAVNVSKEEGRELFVKIIPYLAEQNAINAVFSTDDKHYAAYSHTARDLAGYLTDNVTAVAFMRDLSASPFSEDEARLGSILAEAVFEL